MQELASYTIFETEYVLPGSALTSNSGIWMHPLDIIAMQTPSALDRLDQAMFWLLEKTYKKLDDLSNSLERRIE